MITRFNYEEYFLLYVDSELSATEKNAVEEFVRQNPDLEEELSMLRQSVINPDNNIVFENKESLLKHTDNDSLINLNNYEEYFLLYIDNELDVATKKLVEEFLYRNPSLQNEFHLFQETKLQPEEFVVFAGKETLFKKEEERKPIPFAWIYSAAAVAVLLVAGFLFFNRNNIDKKSPTQSVASTGIPAKKEIAENKKEMAAVTSGKPDSLNDTNDRKKNLAIIEKQEEKQQARYVVIPKRKMNEEKSNEPDDLAINTTDEEIRKNNTGVVQIAEINKETDKRQTASSEIAPSKLIVIIDNQVDHIETNNPNPDDGIASTDNDSEKKTKLRGIFRKVSRVFNKTTNADDDSKHSVAIGSFQIALK